MTVMNLGRPSSACRVIDRTPASTRSACVARAVRSLMRMRATWRLIRLRAVIDAKALSRMVAEMCRATFDGVSKLRWAISSRIVPSRSWPIPVKTGRGELQRIGPVRGR